MNNIPIPGTRQYWKAYKARKKNLKLFGLPILPVVKYKPNMCFDCPHRQVTPSTREWLDELLKGATVPHPCHNDGLYCAGHMIELGIRYEKQI
jgi:TPP-dependent indolepyruvate ferredoxin oxidoreductase alpha subunit